MLLNGWHDREIADYTATDCVLAVTSSLNRNSALAHAPRDYITHLVVPRHGGIYDAERDQGPLAEMGIEANGNAGGGETKAKKKKNKEASNQGKGGGKKGATAKAKASGSAAKDAKERAKKVKQQQAKSKKHEARPKGQAAF